MSDWEEFCEAMKIDPNEPDQFDELLDNWSKDEKSTAGLAYRRVNFKHFLNTRSNPSCSRCGGTGYLGKYKKIADGRCFKCFPDSRWNQLVAHE